MKNEIDFFLRQKNEIGNVVLNKMEILIAGEMADVCGIAGDQIVDGNDTMTFGQQPVR